MGAIIETLFDVGQKIFGLKLEVFDHSAGQFRATAAFVRVSP